MEVTSRIRSYTYREFHEKDEPISHTSAPNPVNGGVEPEAPSRNIVPQSFEMHAGNGPALSAPHSFSTATTSQKVKVCSNLFPTLYAHSIHRSRIK